ncbi:MAG TPA: NAD(P)/FAD-dependent oxidoreductase [Actinomycetota bacterium]|nr:NAD(P)/FAD-dependent oxidoreductase [Actinomycetota bacterium]
MIGAGPNGLVAANLLADRGWDVVVLEAAPEPGGAVRSGELTLPGFTHDLFSAFYPLAAASPVIRGLELERWGLEWRHAPAVLAHPLEDGRAALLSTDVEETAASLDAIAPGDGNAWKELYALWRRTGDAVIAAITQPLVPAVPALRLAGALRTGIPSFVRFGLLSATRLADEHFRGPGGGEIVAGNALHTDLSPTMSPSGFYGWLLASLGQHVGWPVPAGGAGRLTGAMASRLRARGGEVVCGTRVTRIEVRGGRAVAALTADGDAHAARKAVIATTGAPALFGELLDPADVPPRVRDRMERFEYDHATVKVDWALDAAIPWAAPDVRRSAAVHVGGSMDEMVRYASQIDLGMVPDRPFLVLGQMNVADPSRSPAGTETVWAYTHVPQRPARPVASWEDVVDGMEAQIERFASGFRSRIKARHVFTPETMEATNANLVGGAVNGGSAKLHQQLFFRPAPGLARGKTPIKGLYLGSASVHPGGGVHGAPGANAARAALAAERRASFAALAKKPQRPSA